ncbi:MAG: TIGR03747 family integrating conjugative element membrane protein [Gammaproteobacteria bacterium]
MATATPRRSTSSSSAQQAEQGVIGATFTRLMTLLAFAVMTLLFSIATEWIGIATQFWDEPGTQHSELMLRQELEYLNRDFRQSAIVEQPVRFARGFANAFYDATINKTGVRSAVIWLATPDDYSSSTLRRGIKSIYRYMEVYVLSAFTVMQLFAVRLAVLTLAMPAFVMLAAIGLIDGLVQRDIRRWSGGRESSFVYHWAKKILYPSFILPWIVYLGIPISIHPNFVVLPFAILFSVSVWVMSSSFKKYL